MEGIKNPELQKIETIVDKEIRPILQMHGGDLQLIDFKNNVLVIRYQGACGGCPGAAMGTRHMIETILRESYNPNVTVELA